VGESRMGLLGEDETDNEAVDEHTSFMLSLE
jgi:hypothetical protein